LSVVHNFVFKKSGRTFVQSVTNNQGKVELSPHFPCGAGLKIGVSGTVNVSCQEH
jgi:hypothetical protein